LSKPLAGVTTRVSRRFALLLEVAAANARIEKTISGRSR
jgi:hypothetical protein